ncbi:hypothetical protein [Microvirga massiliensis]|uniref:hypothetical protein n=1 Tax=Microvirga massiliensis TaxID=1033741 RepID=UPI00062BE83B|nr:hypothetical protein [Microvirga massiliensis]
MELDALFGEQASPQIDPSAEAATLLTIWRQLERAHVPIAFGCSCGGSIGHVRVQDCEQDILEYLYEKHAQAGTVPALAKLQNLAGCEQRRTGSITALLEAVAEDESGCNVDFKIQLLRDLRRSIDSLSAASVGPLRRVAQEL